MPREVFELAEPMYVDFYEKDKLPTRAGILGKAAAALISDLKEQNLLNQTMIVLGTEFGQSPALNQNDGREHHPAFSGFFAGGGIKGMQFYGTLDKEGLRPDKDAVAIADFNATIAYAMGLPLEQEFFSKSDGRGRWPMMASRC